MGLPRYCAALASEEVEAGSRRDVGLEIGHRRYDTQYSAPRHPLFETLVPIERALGPAYRLILRDRANRPHAVPTTEGDPDAPRAASEVARVASACDPDHMVRVTPLPVSAQEAERLFRLCTGEIPDSVIRAISACPESLNFSGPSVLELFGVSPGATFAGTKRHRQPPRTRVADERPPPGFEVAVNEDAFDVQHGKVPAQSDGRSRVWG